MTTALAHSAFGSYSPEFEQVLGDSPGLSRLVRVRCPRGRGYFADESALYFTTLPRRGIDGSPSVQIKRVAIERPEPVSVVVEEANTANGMAPDGEGALVVCERGTSSEPARISRVDRLTGQRETLVENWRDLPFNSPNDVVVASDR